MRIVLLGSGNTATVLGRMILQAGHEVLQVYSRNEAHAKILGDELSCSHTNDIGSLISYGDLYLVAIADDALLAVQEWLTLGKKLVAHTAGAVSKEVLQQVSKNYGVIYPLQSLRKENRNSPSVPFLVDGNTPENTTLIIDFVTTFSNLAEIANDEQRRHLHLAAVIVNNFTNHLYLLAEKFCEDHQVDFDLLLPLIEETGTRLRNFPIRQLQTGPASRNDLRTIDEQLKMLVKYPSLRNLYQTFTESIKNEFPQLPL